MKRCPECEFIYEDDQSLCDMDGILLVFDSQNLPKQVTRGRLQLRNRIVPAIAVLVLTTVFFLVYYVSTRQSVKRVGYSPSSVSGTQATPAAPATIETLPSAPEAKATTPEAVATPELKSNAKSSESPKAPIKSKSSSRQQRETLNKTQEKDSKIGSLIKKTGRILKKPFKF